MTKLSIDMSSAFKVGEGTTYQKLRYQVREHTKLSKIHLKTPCLKQ